MFRETSKLVSLYVWSVYRCLYFCIPDHLDSQMMFRNGDVKLYISQVEGSIPDSVIGILHIHGPGVDAASNRRE